jgi:hypothetical protein
MKYRRALLTTIVGGVFFFGLMGPAVAEQEEVKALSPWEGDGYTFPIGNDRIFMVAVFTGTIFVEDGKGALHTGSIVCPATVEGDLKTMTKTGKGHCIITNDDGDRIYADYTCTGDLEACRGPFTLVGGTGKFTGITGGGEMISRIQSRALLLVEGFESAHQQGEGIAIWPKLTYQFPDTP